MSKLTLQKNLLIWDQLILAKRIIFAKISLFSLQIVLFIIFVVVNTTNKNNHSLVALQITTKYDANRIFTNLLYFFLILLWVAIHILETLDEVSLELWMSVSISNTMNLPHKPHKFRVVKYKLMWKILWMRLSKS